jgi:hypothetical protein
MLYTPTVQNATNLQHMLHTRDYVKQYIAGLRRNAVIMTTGSLSCKSHSLNCNCDLNSSAGSRSQFSKRRAAAATGRSGSSCSCCFKGAGQSTSDRP